MRPRKTTQISLRPTAEGIGYSAKPRYGHCDRECKCKGKRFLSSWENVMGRKGLGTMNKNGCRLAEFCALNYLV